MVADPAAAVAGDARHPRGRRAVVESAGGDLDWVESLLASPRPYLENIIAGRKIVMGILDCAKPIICRLNGDAIGLGATLSLLCDICIAAEDAHLADPHVRIGLVAGDGGALIWPQLVGYAKAKEYLLTGNRISAPEAARIGLINYAVKREELDATVERFTARLLAASSHAKPRAPQEIYGGTFPYCELLALHCRGAA